MNKNGPRQSRLYKISIPIILPSSRIPPIASQDKLSLLQKPSESEWHTLLLHETHVDTHERADTSTHTHAPLSILQLKSAERLAYEFPSSECWEGLYCRRSSQCWLLFLHFLVAYFEGKCDVIQPININLKRLQLRFPPKMVIREIKS